MYDEPQLNKLELRLLANNSDLEAAYAHFMQAQAFVAGGSTSTLKVCRLHVFDANSQTMLFCHENVVVTVTREVQRTASRASLTALLHIRA